MVDFCLNKNSISDIKSEIDLILQQVDILFDTTPTEVLGSLAFGTEYDKYLYSMKLSADNLKRVVEQDLSQLTLFDWKYDVKTYLLQGTEQDIAVIDINFYNGAQVVNKTYKIT